MGEALCRTLLFRRAVRLLALSARAAVPDGAARRFFLYRAALRAFFWLGRRFLARLAARLVGYKIDIKPESYQEEE